ncbi:MAG: 2,3-bisphosphoglycerate-independent phosphoglycerate mutase [Saprospiraceae bacterium]
MPTTQHALLVILDGWGLSPNPEVSAIEQASTPTMDALYQKYPHTTLVTFGEEVGLPAGQMGNSEVGHLNIGAGRVVYQDFTRINIAIRNNTLVNNPTLVEALNYAKANNKPVHLLGLVSDGGVHSHINHLLSLCDIIDGYNVPAYIHAFMDGRDTDPKGGANYLTTVNDHIQNKSAKLASVIGRYYAMDRDNRWERIKLAYDLIVKGEGEKVKGDIVEKLQERYAAGETDEFIQPIIMADKKGQAVATIKEGDVVLFYNYRTDRPREITSVLTQKAQPDYGMQPLDLHFVTMTRYDESFKGLHVMFTKDNLKNTLGEVIAGAGKTQFRIAETEKYPHVTFFFSGGREEEFTGESRFVAPSPKVATYDLKPEMSAHEVTNAVINKITTDQPNFICLNYANTDMVGHTGDMAAAIKATETVDGCLGELLETALAHNYEAIIIADHGNSDTMINPDGSPNTAHTTNMVPCIFVSKNVNERSIVSGKLGDIAPTILDLLGISSPEEMTGKVLVK